MAMRCFSFQFNVIEEQKVADLFQVECCENFKTTFA